MAPGGGDRGTNKDNPQCIEDDTVALYQFAVRNFRRRECKVFQWDGKKPRNKSAGDVQFCYCGRLKEWHEKRNLEIRARGEESVAWSVEQCTEELPTNSFGKIEMLGFARNKLMAKSKFLRLDTLHTDMVHLRYFMIHHWKMRPPQLIISLNGGSKKMEKLDDRLIHVINKGLYHVSSSLETWIITTGSNQGVARLMGQVSQEMPIQARVQRRKMVVLGIVPWGLVNNRRSLLNPPNPSDLGAAMYHRYVNAPSKSQRSHVILDSNHTHFLLVDDGKSHVYNTEVAFRHKWEAFMAKSNRLIGSCPTMKVQLLIEGGHAALPLLDDELDSGYPIIVIRHSSRCADLVCNMLEKTNPNMNQSEISDIFYEELTNFPNWDLSDTIKAECLAVIVRVVRNQAGKIYVFDYTKEDDNELDKFILKVILNLQCRYTQSKHSEVIENCPGAAAS